MSNECSCRPTCKVLSIVASIIIGITAAILRFNAVITLTPAFLWVVLGTAVAYQAILLITSAFSRSSVCTCPLLSLLQTGILGAILTSVILLAVPFESASALGTILAGAAVAFFALVFTATSCLIKCLSSCGD